MARQGSDAIRFFDSGAGGKSASDSYGPSGWQRRRQPSGSEKRTTPVAGKQRAAVWLKAAAAGDHQRGKRGIR